MKKYFVVLFLLAGGIFVFPPSVSADAMPSVVLNEVLWMGSSASANDEWIELRNTTTSDIDMTGWRLTKLSAGAESSMITIASGNISAGGFFVIANEAAATSRLLAEPQFVDTAMSLVNTKLQIKLYDAANVLIDIADDGSGAPLAGDYQSGSVWKSMERNPLGVDGADASSWHTASLSLGFDDDLKEWGTPGTENSNSAPVLVANVPESGKTQELLSFDASETIDPENDVITVQWEFGDATRSEGMIAEHRYMRAGTYRVFVRASDGRASSEAEFSLTITEDPAVSTAPSSGAPPPSTPATLQAPKSQPKQSSTEPRINEVLPDPDGSDEQGEFIEISNPGKTSLDLRGWKISDIKREYRFTESMTIAPSGFLLLPRALTKLTLRNDGSQELFLVDPQNRVVHGVLVKKAKTGKSFSRTDDEAWVWSEPTPGARNSILVQEDEGSADASEEKDGYTPATIADVFRLPKRTKVIVRGTVIVAPGIFGTTFFYMQDGKRGLQIFFSKAEFPELSLGDVLEVRGTVGEAGGERKINVALADDITIVDAGDAPEALVLGSATPSGVLVSLEGTIEKKRSGTIDVRTPEALIRVSIPKGADIDVASLTVGTSVRIVGVWRVTKDGGKVLPRGEEDIEVAGAVKGETTNNPLTTPSAHAQEILVPEGEDDSPLLQYLLPLSVLVLVGGGYWWWKRNRVSSHSDRNETEGRIS